MKRIRRRAEQYMQGLLRKYVRRRKEMTNLLTVLVCCCKARASVGMCKSYKGLAFNGRKRSGI